MLLLRKLFLNGDECSVLEDDSQYLPSTITEDDEVLERVCLGYLLNAMVLLLESVFYDEGRWLCGCY